jgi:selenide, water dikinase
LGSLPRESDPRILVGRETFDDAGVFRVSDDVALVQTLDFFAPIVDDPYDFGQIAAANSLSDVFAMGGQPMTALSIVGFPQGKLPLEVLTEVSRGAQDKVHEAGAFLIGGHTVVDDELKFGLSVTGRVHPNFILTNAGARVGDRLVLTKAIGNGLLATAVKNGVLSVEDQREMLEAMKLLNGAASRAALAVGVKCATDVTGFGLLGHASHIARASEVTLRIRVRDVPILKGARDVWLNGMRTGGGKRNMEYLASMTSWASTSEVDRVLLCDPQTSGGLFVAVPPARVNDYLSRVPNAVEIGEVLPKSDVAIIVE